MMTKPSSDAHAQMQRGLQQIADGITTFASGLADLLHGAFAALTPFFTRMGIVLYARYLSAGMPYGESRAGMLRWLKETTETLREEERAWQAEIRAWYAAGGRGALPVRIKGIPLLPAPSSAT